MKTSLLSLVLAASASANIIFNHVPLTCSKENKKIYHGCLREQFCNKENQCEAIAELVRPRRNKATPGVFLRATTTGPVYSKDGSCGSQNNGTICDPHSTVYNGSCCSEYGWCGNTDAHCGAGCQSGCNTPGITPTPSSSTSPRTDGHCGKDYGDAACDPKGSFGGCCSAYGWCGTGDDHCLVANGCQSGCSGPLLSTSAEPVIVPATSTAPPSATATAAVTTDGSCGSSNNNTICGNWPQGNCCSMYGFCGSTSAHCGAGCQSGDCISAPITIAPGPSPAPANPVPGHFEIVGQAGVPAMHAALMPNGRVFFLDKVENYTQLILPNGQYAYSSEYDPETHTAVPLAYLTNAFCSGGAFLRDGRVISVGGNAPLPDIDTTVGDGFKAIRYLHRDTLNNSLNGQYWSEPGNKINSGRWYASVQTMPDGTIFVASGSLNGLDPTVQANNNPTYELLDANAVSTGPDFPMEILAKNQPYYMYPFVHLLKDGTLFVFVSKSSEQFSVSSNTAIRTYPDLPGDYRTYPNTGGSVLLPIRYDNDWKADIMICGGGAYQDVSSPTDASCGRISPLAADPKWEMDSMPESRGIVEGTLLPDGTVIWLNGGSRGAQGFGLMREPALEALLYDPDLPHGERWSTLASSTIPRLYHSVAVLLLDGRLLIAGSNPVEQPMLKPTAAEPYVTEFRVEVYTPPYLQNGKADTRPTDLTVSSEKLSPGDTFEVEFSARHDGKEPCVVLYHGGFVTHSVHMGHRMVVLESDGWVAGTAGNEDNGDAGQGGKKGMKGQRLNVYMPGAEPGYKVLPPGPYVLYVLVDGVPGVGKFVSVV